MVKDAVPGPEQRESQSVAFRAQAVAEEKSTRY